MSSTQRKSPQVEWRDIYKGDLTLAERIWSMNAERRHLTVDQYLATRIVVSGYIEREAAKIRQVVAGAHGKDGGRGHKKPLQTNSSEGVCDAEARTTGTHPDRQATRCV